MYPTKYATGAIHEVAGHLLVTDELAAMRHWLADCSRSGLDLDEVHELTPAEVVAGVRRHYPGGVRSFLAEMEL